jgi:hypothetical protein
VNHIITFADLRKAKEVLEFIYKRVEERRVALAERTVAGHGDVCRLCGTIIEGADDHELLGYCSKTCQREDGKSEWPSPNPDYSPNPDDLAKAVAKGEAVDDPVLGMFGVGKRSQKP